MPPDPKNYVVCIDGTGNSPHHLDHGSASRDPATTNVFRIFQFLTGSSHHTDGGQAGFSQPILFHNQSTDLGQVFYRWGVGTRWEPTPQWLRQYAGFGTLSRIRSAYRFLATHHHEGDKVFAFGFSRGAFAVRSLAGLLQHSGLPAPGHMPSDAEFDDVAEAYFSHKPAVLRPNFRPAAVNFLGIWDTVGYLKASTAWHDISPQNVDRVAHALALDESRPQFAAALWSGPKRAGQTVREAWFTGAHSNIGGGYKDDELSNVAAAWVFREAFEAGLPVPDQAPDFWAREHVLGTARDSHKEFLTWSNVFGSRLKGRATPRSVPIDHHIHRSVLDRMAGNKDSPYNMIKSADFVGWQSYKPSARMADGSAFTTQWPLGQIAETDDYLQ